MPEPPCQVQPPAVPDHWTSYALVRFRNLSGCWTVKQHSLSVIGQTPNAYKLIMSQSVTITTVVMVHMLLTVLTN